MNFLKIAMDSWWGLEEKSSAHEGINNSYHQLSTLAHDLGDLSPPIIWTGRLKSCAGRRVWDRRGIFADRRNMLRTDATSCRQTQLVLDRRCIRGITILRIAVF